MRQGVDGANTVLNLYTASPSKGTLGRAQSQMRNGYASISSGDAYRNLDSSIMTSGKREHMNSVMLPGYASIRELKDQKNKI
mmetsp:Transcript_22959/g.35414  ORF Transcript_22959/g.35414 Transcript_22959/m.35414 type:complete len:82 (-) Transcript_22959:1324-1569(-)